MVDHAVGELGLEPGRLRRHDEACIGHRHQVGHLRRIEREGDRHLAGFHARLEPSQPARAADEVDALVGARILDAEQRLDHVAGEHRDRQPADRIARHQIGADREPVPAAGEIHPIVMRGRRTHRLAGRCHREALGQLGEQLFGAAAVQVLHHAIVIEDGHLAFGEDHRQEIAVRTFALARGGDARGRRRAVMAVGDVDRRQGVEGAAELADRGVVGDHPELVAHAVVGGDVDLPACRRPCASSASIAGAFG